jgi:hypothetical protein
MQIVCECCQTAFEFKAKGGTKRLFCSRICRNKVHNARQEAYRLSLTSEIDLDPIPPPEVVAEKRHAYSHFQSIFGDPLPGRSALDRKVRP